MNSESVRICPLGCKYSQLIISPPSVIPNPNPSSTLSLLLRVLSHLTATTPGSPSWPASSIHLFGFAQGGSCAGELSLAFTRSTKLSLGSAVVVSAPLLSHPTVQDDGKSEMKVLLCARKGEERMVGAGSWRKGFKEVKEVSLARGEGMLRGQSEWMEVMRCVRSSTCFFFRR